MTFAEPNNITGIKELFDYSNSVSEGNFYLMIPITLYLVVFLWLKGKSYETSDCFIASGFFTMIVTIILYSLETLTTFHLGLVSLAFAGSILAAYWRK